jgi:hypothetical protein
MSPSNLNTVDMPPCCNLKLLSITFSAADEAAVTAAVSKLNMSHHWSLQHVPLSFSVYQAAFSSPTNIQISKFTPSISPSPSLTTSTSSLSLGHCLMADEEGNTAMRSIAADTETDKEFTLFPNLPLEVRRMIWRKALPGSRLIFISRPCFPTPEEIQAQKVRAAKESRIWGPRYAAREDREKVLFWEPRCNEKPPAVLFTCKESRAEALRFYRSLGCERTWFVPLKKLHVDLGVDVICVKDWGMHDFVNQLTDDERANLKLLAVDDTTLTTCRGYSRITAVDDLAKLTGLKELRFVSNMWQMVKLDGAAWKMVATYKDDPTWRPKYKVWSAQIDQGIESVKGLKKEWEPVVRVGEFVGGNGAKVDINERAIEGANRRISDVMG